MADIEIKLNAKQVELLQKAIDKYGEEIDLIPEYESRVNEGIYKLFRELADNWVRDCANNSCMMYYMHKPYSNDTAFTYYENLSNAAAQYDMEYTNNELLDRRIAFPMLNKDGTTPGGTIGVLTAGLLREFDFDY